MSGSCAQGRWEKNLEVLKQGELCSQKGEDRPSKAAGWRVGWLEAPTDSPSTLG